MTAAAQAFDTFLPFWRASIPPSIPLAYFDAFVVRMRPTLETIVGGFFERRQARRDQSLPPESMTKASRTRRSSRCRCGCRPRSRWRGCRRSRRTPPRRT